MDNQIENEKNLEELEPESPPSIKEESIYNIFIYKI